MQYESMNVFLRAVVLLLSNTKKIFNAPRDTQKEKVIFEPINYNTRVSQSLLYPTNKSPKANFTSPTS